ncbi:Heme A synthase [Rickettsiales bacterium Ac37b]|nr:Heme A synthase [Rickettsiales bacterium Ac37b]
MEMYQKFRRNIIDTSYDATQKHIAMWLFLCALMILLMVALGGITRLTHSGLSIVEWRPITGIIPPLSLEDWIVEFKKYQASLEYKYINFGMTLEEFKQIFLIEYVHRLIGRITGIVFILPLIYFIIRKEVNKVLINKLFLILVIGLLQGIIGWYMVRSGLEDHYDVSQYRLALHLITAVIIYGFIIWIALDCWYQGKFLHISTKLIGSSKHANLNVILILIQIVSGAFVAGTNAGLVYNNFPLMDGSLVPSGLFRLSPWYQNIFENIITIQFIHRVLATLIVASIVIFFIKNYRINLNKRVNSIILCLLIVLIIQVFLGISTLIYRIPTVLALLHQIGALLLFSVALYTSWLIRMQERYLI